MTELLQKVLTDPAVRRKSSVKLAAINTATNYTPWTDDEA